MSSGLKKKVPWGNMNSQIVPVRTIRDQLAEPTIAPVRRCN